MASSHGDSHRQGSVKDPEHDGRLKENREAGRTKETTPGSKARAEEHGKGGESSQSRSHESHKSSHESHKSGHESGGGSKSHESGSQARSGESGGSDDLKSREYKDAEGNVHHHTKTYMEQHGDQHGKK